MSITDFIGSLASSGGEVAHGLMAGKMAAAEQRRQQAASDIERQRFLLQQAAQAEEQRHNQMTEQITANRTPEGYVDPNANRAAWESLPDNAFPGGHKPAFVPGDNWVKVRERFLTGELGQQNQTQLRVMFPPQGNQSMDNLTRVQTVNLVRQQAEAMIRNMARDNFNRRGRGLTAGDYAAVSQRFGGVSTPDELAQAAQDEYRKANEYQQRWGTP